MQEIDGLKLILSEHEHAVTHAGKNCIWHLKIYTTPVVDLATYLNDPAGIKCQIELVGQYMHNRQHAFTLHLEQTWPEPYEVTYRWLHKNKGEIRIDGKLF